MYAEKYVKVCGYSKTGHGSKSELKSNWEKELHVEVCAHEAS